MLEDNLANGEALKEQGHKEIPEATIGKAEVGQVNRLFANAPLGSAASLLLWHAWLCCALLYFSESSEGLVSNSCNKSWLWI